MNLRRVPWAAWVRWVATATVLTGCIDATTVYTVPDMPPPSGDDGAAADDGAAGEAGDEASDAPAPGSDGGAGD